MDDVARQLERARREIAGLLRAYPGVSDAEKEVILDECEHLGGEVQELVGLLKIGIRDVVSTTRALHEDEPARLGHVEQIARYGLRVAHCAGEEVSAAVRLIRRLRATQPARES